MGKIVILGAGGHAKVVVEILRLLPQCELAGFLDADPGKRGLRVLGLRVLGGDEMLEDLRQQKVAQALAAVGDNRRRGELFARARQAGFELVRAVHPAAAISPTARLGAGTVAMAGVVVNAEAMIGENVILNTGCSVDHSAQVGDHAHIAPGAHLGGEVRVGTGAFIGLGASIRPGVTVGEWAVVGSGAAVIENVRPHGCVVGVPAREKTQQ